MTTFPNSPRLQKGALIGLDLFNPLASIVIFQYNPETITRTSLARTTPTVCHADAQVTRAVVGELSQ